MLYGSLFLFSPLSFRIDSFSFHSVQYDYSWINFLLQKYCRTNESISFILFILEHWNSCSLTTRTHHIVEWYSNGKWVWVRKRVLYGASPLFFPRLSLLCVLNCFVFSEQSIGHLSFYTSGIAVACGLIENFVIFFIICIFRFLFRSDRMMQISFFSYLTLNHCRKMSFLISILSPYSIGWLSHRMPYTFYVLYILLVGTKHFIRQVWVRIFEQTISLSAPNVRSS